MSVVSLKNVFKSYPLGKERIEAVKGVSFDIEKGEFAAISGPSGSGKSTILNMIGLIDLPSAGSIVIGGTDVYDGVNLEDAEVLNTRWVSSGDNKKKKIRKSIPAKLDKKITGLRRSHLGFIFQTFNLIPVLNVYENIEFPLLLESKNSGSKSPVDDFTKAQKEEQEKQKKLQQTKKPESNIETSAQLQNTSSTAQSGNTGKTAQLGTN